MSGPIDLDSAASLGLRKEEPMSTASCVAAAAAISYLSFVASADIATAAQIKILAGSAIETSMAVLIPQFEKSSGHKVIFDFDGAIGAMTDRIQRGEAADVVIVSGPQIEMLQAQGKVVAGSRVDIAKVGIGLFVRKGAAKPDIP
jgi:molybdate transport system substrate-binding protein